MNIITTFIVVTVSVLSVALLVYRHIIYDIKADYDPQPLFPEDEDNKS